MSYLSELIRKPVIDCLGKKIGTLEDLILSKWIDQKQPVITAILVLQGLGSIALKIDQVDSIKTSGIVLKCAETDAS